MYTHWIDELYSIINRGIVTLQPYGGSSGAGKIFTGSYDWHSCVHAHWASISIDVFKDRPKQLLSRLCFQNVSDEYEYLTQDLSFENPYGRSWFLLLLSELNDNRFLTLKDNLCRNLTLRLENSNFPEGETIIGTHHSWMFSYFLLRLSHIIDDSNSKILDQQFLDKLQPLDQTLESYDHNVGGITWDFIDRSCLYATIRLLEGKELSDIHLQNLYRIKDEFLGSNYDNLGKKEAHVPGRLAMISWPFALFDEHSHHEILSKIQEHKYFYAGDFHCFSHWIPQFIWMSIYLKNIRVFSR
ncbi:MAG: DUF2891 family protein [Candidatus Cloacimonetes bacterium]|nr:DUF2891 family protein [Candidatus Cloacimonadota bacterium]